MMQYELFDSKYEELFLLAIDWVGILNYSLVQSQISMIDSIYVGNNTKTVLKHLTLSIRFDESFIEGYERTIDELEAGKGVEWTPKLNLFGKKVFDLTEMVNDQMHIQLLDEEKNVLAERTWNIPVVPLNSWSGNRLYPQSLAAFVMPNIPQVTALQKRASQILMEKTGSPAFTAYYSESKTAVMDQMAAIYAAIYEQNISYAVAPPSFEIGQRIRTIPEILQVKMANCIEMSVLFAAVAESCGLNPFIVLLKGHAFVGCWLKSGLFEGNYIYDFAELSKRLPDGINDLEVLEATYMTIGQNKTFSQAVRSARGIMDEPSRFTGLIDIRRSHYTGIRPFPLIVHDQEEVRLIDYGLAEDANDMADQSRTVEEYFLDTSKKEAVDKRTIWMRSLLDLSKRNSLISFRIGSKSLQLFQSELDQLENALSNGQAFQIKESFSEWELQKTQMKIVDVESDKEVISRFSQAEFQAKRIRTFLPKNEMLLTLKSLYREAKLTAEENGASSLFLALGFLLWYDPNDPRDAEGMLSARYAPLILLPVELVRKSSQTYYLQLRDEDAQMNITLLEMLRQKFNLQISGLSPLPEDASGVDVKLVFNSIRKAVMEQKGWDVIEAAVLGNFSFSQFVMWEDMNKRFDALMKNRVIHSLVEGRYRATDQQNADIKTDEVLRVKELAIPTSVDASQLKAVVEAASGRDFILHGPPGTGKSQTITNMIANALFQGKSVLFVAEKMAALNVVYDRLAKIGLADFCLEIHSNKTKKNVVLEKFGHCIELKKEADDPEFARNSEQLEIQKQQLQEVVAQLHAKQECGSSIYELINESGHYRHLPRYILFQPGTLQALNRAKREQMEDALERLVLAAGRLSVPMAQHPLRAFCKAGYQLHRKDELNRRMTDLKQYLDQCFQLPQENRSILLHMTFQEPQIRWVVGLLSLFKERNFKVVLSERGWQALYDQDLRTQLYACEEAIRQYVQLKTDIDQHFNGDVSDLDWQRMKADLTTARQSLFFKGKKSKDAVKDLYVLAKEGVVEDENQALHWLDTIADYQNKKQYLMEQARRFGQILAYDFVNALDGLDELADVAVMVRYLEQEGQLQTVQSWPLLRFMAGVHAQPLLQEQWNLTVQAREHVEQIAELTGISVSRSEEAVLHRLAADLEFWCSHLELWKEWSVFYESIEQLQSLQMAELVSYIRKLIHGNTDVNKEYRVEIQELKVIVLASLIPGLIQFYISQSAQLSRFSGLQYEHLIKQYNECVDRYEWLVQKQIRARLTQYIPDVYHCSDEEAAQLARLKKASQSKGRGVTLRQIFQDNGRVIKRLTPCLLMSPLSVAQYIDMEFPKFDIVVFDEASQIRTCTAIGALSRAEHSIIVGDPQQMPPTSFFSSQKLDEENIQLEDLESLLEDCLAINMPQRYLTCHYRSASESLISFSNYMYYDNKMMTFPSPLDRQSKVQYERVNGIYDRGRERTNRVEAEAIVREIKNRVMGGRNESIGVVTFNVQQQNLIDDLLQGMLLRDRAFDERLNEMPEPLFIKNLENVQGDERDVILFSVAFGPDETGKFYQNFGPLAKKGGWRRLNVAVSRARREMKVFASIGAEDINLTAKSSEGVKGIKNFLEYAQYGRLHTSIVGREITGLDDILTKIAGRIMEKGYRIDSRIGYSNFKLQLAIIDPTNPLKYCAAIRIDDGDYAQVETVRDRVRLIPTVLQSKGWKLYQIWTLDWYENEEKEWQRLEDFLTQLPDPQAVLDVSDAEPDEVKPAEVEPDEAESVEVKPDKAEPNEMKAVEVKPHGTVLLKTAQMDEEPDEQPLQAAYEQLPQMEKQLSVEPPEILPVLSTREPEVMASIRVQETEYTYYQSSEIWDSTLLRTRLTEDVSLAQAILQCEAPIHETTLKRRLLEHYGGVKLTKITRDYCDSVLKKVKSRKKKEGENIFYWGEQNPLDYHLYRVVQKPDLTLMSQQELANAMYSVVERIPDIEVVELYKETAKLFGFGRTTTHMTEIFDTALAVLKKRKWIALDRVGVHKRMDEENCQR